MNIFNYLNFNSVFADKLNLLWNTEYGCVVDFLLFALILNVFLTIIASNPIHAVLLLVLCYMQLSIILMEFGSQFIPLIIFFIYSGAISILLIFILMILDLKIILYGGLKALSFLIYFFILLLLLLTYFYFSYYGDFFYYTTTLDYEEHTNFIEILYYKSELTSIGVALFNFYFFHFVLIAILILVSLIGSISLVISKSFFLKKQNYYSQILSTINNIRIT